MPVSHNPGLLEIVIVVHNKTNKSGNPHGDAMFLYLVDQICLASAQRLSEWERTVSGSISPREEIDHIIVYNPLTVDSVPHQSRTGPTATSRLEKYESRCEGAYAVVMFGA